MYSVVDPARAHSCASRLLGRPEVKKYLELKRDELFNSSLTELECMRIREFYRVFEAEDNFQTVIFDGVHELDKGEEELDFLFKNLLK